MALSGPQIKQARAKSGLTQKDVAEHLNVSVQAVSQWESGSTVPTGTNLVALANLLKLPLGDVFPGSAALIALSNLQARGEVIKASGDEELTQTNLPMVPALVSGTVEAGSWREIDDFDQSEPETVWVPADPDYPSARVLVFDVSGSSMNDLKPYPILPGMRAICVAYEDVATRVTLRDGMVVVVQRTRDGGHTREFSIKQIEYYADRVEFHPRSSDARYKPIIVPHNYEADDGITVEIAGLLRSVMATFPRY